MAEGQAEAVPMMFLFMVDSILAGFVSLFGFVGNTLAFAAMRYCRRISHDNEPRASLTLLLQVVAISNIGVLWSMFLMHVVPALGFVIPLLHDCSVACHLIVSFIHPIYLGSRALVVWMTVASLAYSGKLGLATENSTPRNALKSSSARLARWTITASSLIVCFWSALMIADSWIVLSRNGNNDTMSTMTLEQSFWYHLICVETASVLTVVIPLLVGCGILFARCSGTCSYCGGEFVKPLSRLFLFMFLCYLPEIVSNVVDAIDQFSTDQDVIAIKGWTIYTSAGSRLCIAAYSSLGTLLMLLLHDEFRRCIRDTCQGKTPFRQELERQKSRRIYKCDDATKVTLISPDDEGTRFIRDRDITKFAGSVYRTQGNRNGDEELILRDGEVICNV